MINFQIKTDFFNDFMNSLLLLLLQETYLLYKLTTFDLKLLYNSPFKQAHSLPLKKQVKITCE